jgi:hypothetical protein
MWASITAKAEFLGFAYLSKWFNLGVLFLLIGSGLSKTLGYIAHKVPTSCKLNCETGVPTGLLEIESFNALRRKVFFPVYH